MDLGTRRLWEQGQDTIIEEAENRCRTLIDFSTITETLTPTTLEEKDLLATGASVGARIVIEMMREAEIACISKTELAFLIHHYKKTRHEQ